MSKLSDRPTPDLVVIFLAGVVGVLVVGSLVGVVILEATNAVSEANIAQLAGRVADVTNTLIGAIVGYLAGRGREHRQSDDDA